ncbi:hypothetical protein DXG01_011256 [Tephrocybe rancida]|nr:hypothetical protein DXG01_011256 [Tephrocybe rancida]
MSDPGDRKNISGMIVDAPNLDAQVKQSGSGGDADMKNVLVRLRDRLDQFYKSDKFLAGLICLAPDEAPQ